MYHKEGFLLHIVDSSEYVINNVKCYDSGDKLRITFNWPFDIQQVYIFATKSAIVVAEQVNQGCGKLFTLQEYKKLGGFFTEKIQGEMSYYIYPFMREDGQDILYDQNNENYITFVEKTIVTYQIREKRGLSFDDIYKNYEVTFEANYPVQENIVCYTKKKNELPRDINDGTLYYFGEPINPRQQVKRVIRTLRNEHVRLFINNNRLFDLVEHRRD